jgi:sRNA-binding protein
MTYVNREMKEATIERLAEAYPRCFFADPKQRIPLKKSIIDDLLKDGFPVAKELLVASVEWYQSHMRYQYALVTGAPRVDLLGKTGSKVTEQEHKAAQKQIEVIARQRKEEREPADPVNTLNVLYANNQITDDDLKKLDARRVLQPPTPTPEGTSQKLTLQLHEALLAADVALAKNSITPTLRVAMATAALTVLMQEAQRLITSLQQEM